MAIYNQNPLRSRNMRVGIPNAIQRIAKSDKANLRHCLIEYKYLKSPNMNK